MTRVLVTGAAGFIGRALCERLRAEGRQVLALVRRPGPGPWDEAVTLTLGAEPIPPGLTAGVECIFHLAGRAHAIGDGPDAEAEYRRGNVQGTLDLLESAGRNGVETFVYFSSIKAMGEGGAEIQDETAVPAPVTAYGRTKLAAEQAVLHGGQVPHPVVLRPALVYGPSPKGHLELMIRAVKRGWFPPLPEAGNRRSMIHLDDLVEAALLVAADPRAAGRIYILTDGMDYSTRDLYLAICAALGRPVPGWSLPWPVLRLAAVVGDAGRHVLGRRLPFDSEALEKLAGSARYSGERIRWELGFRPRRRLADAMAEMVASVPGARS